MLGTRAQEVQIARAERYEIRDLTREVELYAAWKLDQMSPQLTMLGKAGLFGREHPIDHSRERARSDPNTLVLRVASGVLIDLASRYMGRAFGMHPLAADPEQAESVDYILSEQLQLTDSAISPAFLSDQIAQLGALQPGESLRDKYLQDMTQLIGIINMSYKRSLSTVCEQIQSHLRPNHQLHGLENMPGLLSIAAHVQGYTDTEVRGEGMHSSSASANFIGIGADSGQNTFVAVLHTAARQHEADEPDTCRKIEESFATSIIATKQLPVVHLSRSDAMFTELTGGYPTNGIKQEYVDTTEEPLRLRREVMVAEHAHYRDNQGNLPRKTTCPAFPEDIAFMRDVIILASQQWRNRFAPIR
jgi:hypothetical protein